MGYNRTKKSGIRKFTLLDVVAESKVEFGGLLFVELLIRLSNSMHLFTWDDIHRALVGWRACGELVAELPWEGREGETEGRREWERVSSSRAPHSDRRKATGATFTRKLRILWVQAEWLRGSCSTDKRCRCPPSAWNPALLLASRGPVALDASRDGSSLSPQTAGVLQQAPSAVDSHRAPAEWMGAQGLVVHLGIGGPE